MLMLFKSIGVQRRYIFFSRTPMVTPNYDTALLATMRAIDRAHKNLTERELALLANIRATKARIARIMPLCPHTHAIITADVAALRAETEILDTDSKALLAAMTAVNVELEMGARQT